MAERPPENLYEQLVENAGDLIVVLDEAGRIAFVNSRVHYYPGFTADGTTGRHYTELVYSEDHSRFQELLESAFRGVPVVDYQFRVPMPDGTLSYWVTNAQLFDLGDRSLLMGICRDVTESLNVKNELVERNRALAALGQIAVALARPGGLDQALSQALDQILAALGLTVGAITLQDAEGRLRIAASTAPEPLIRSSEAIEAGKLISQECIARGERIVVPDTTDQGVDPLIRQMSTALGVKAFIAMPLLSKHAVKAALSIAVEPPGKLSDAQNEFLQLACGILGPAIDNASLHADLADRVDRLAMLEHLARSINSGRDVQTVLSSCMKEIAHLVPYDVGVVVLFGRGSTGEIFEFARDGEPTETRLISLDDTQVQAVSEVNQPTVVSNMHALGQYHSHPSTFDMRHGSAYVVPLIRMGERFGLLKVYSEQPDRYGEHEMSILAAAAEHLSIAASNAAMYETEQKRSLELAALASEVRHRVKNNLQMISGLLEMSRSDPEPNSRTIERCLRQVRAISTIHDLLSPADISAGISVKECLLEVAKQAVQAMARADDIEVFVTGDDYMISSDAAAALGVMVNELVSNAVEHGFGAAERGRVEIRASCRDATGCVEVIDNGVGLPDDFVLPRPGGSATGLGLVSSLAEYGLGGALEIERRERGVCARITVKGVKCGTEGIGS